jgi:RimJ/RimL family protein N-acetyltransferase
VEPAIISFIRLRDIELDDLPRMFEFQLEPESNQLAVTYPRSIDAFDFHWKNVLSDTNITAKAITAGNVMVGHISCFKKDGLDAVGYWIGRDFWGKGIATHALALLLSEVSLRPLYAHVATTNEASLRVLQKSGFVIERVQLSPADDRYPECEEAVLVLK